MPLLPLSTITGYQVLCDFCQNDSQKTDVLAMPDAAAKTALAAGFVKVVILSSDRYLCPKCAKIIKAGL